MAGEFALPGAVFGAGMYATGKFIYSALETYEQHSGISDKDELSQEDRIFLEESITEVEHYLKQSKKDRLTTLILEPEELGKNWGHFIAANEQDVYDGEFQYNIPGHVEGINDLLEPQG